MITISIHRTGYQQSASDSGKPKLDNFMESAPMTLQVNHNYMYNIITGFKIDMETVSANLLPCMSFTGHLHTHTQ